MGLSVWNNVNLGLVCGTDGCSTVGHPKFSTYAESALPLLKHRKLNFITQEAFIKMLGNQPTLPLEAKKKDVWQEEDWTILLCCKELKCCTLPEQQHLVSLRIKHAWSKPKPGHDCNSNYGKCQKGLETILNNDRKTKGLIGSKQKIFVDIHFQEQSTKKWKKSQQNKFSCFLCEAFRYMR